MSKNTISLRLVRIVVLVALVLAPAVMAHGQTSPQELVAQVKRALVTISIYDQRGNALLQESGFFIASDRIVTRLRVIQSAGDTRITTFDEKTVSIRSVITKDAKSDVVLLQTSPPCQCCGSIQVEKIAPLSSSHWKIAIGPNSRSWTFEHIATGLQIDVSPGQDSGKPDLELRAYVIGGAAKEP